MKTNERPNSDTRVDRQLRAGNAMYRGGYIAMIERQLAEARDEIARINKSLNNASAIYDAACEQRDRLAEALRDIKDRAQDATIVLHPDSDAKGCVDDVLEWSEQALAAVKGGPQ